MAEEQAEMGLDAGGEQVPRKLTQREQQLAFAEKRVKILKRAIKRDKEIAAERKEREAEQAAAQREAEAQAARDATAEGENREG